MAEEQFANDDGRFYHSDFKNDDFIQEGEVFGVIQNFEPRKQKATVSGRIKDLINDGAKVYYKNVLCVIEPVQPPPVADASGPDADSEG